MSDLPRKLKSGSWAFLCRHGTEQIGRRRQSGAWSIAPAKCGCSLEELEAIAEECERKEKAPATRTEADSRLGTLIGGDQRQEDSAEVAGGATGSTSEFDSENPGSSPGPRESLNESFNRGEPAEPNERLGNDGKSSGSYVGNYAEQASEGAQLNNSFNRGEPKAEPNFTMPPDEEPEPEAPQSHGDESGGRNGASGSNGAAGGGAARASNGFGAATYRTPLNQWRSWLMTECFRLLLHDPEYKDKPIPAETLLEPMIRDIKDLVAMQLSAGILPPELSETEQEEEIGSQARTAIEHWAARKIWTKIDASGGKKEEAPPAEVTDPILRAIDQAIVETIEIKAGITFERANAYLDRTRIERGKSIVLCEGLMRSRNLTMLCGRAWSGKSTIATNLARSFVMGDRFMERECRKSAVGYMALERNGEEVAAQFEAWGMAEQVFFKDQVPIGTPREMAHALAYAIHREGLEIIFVDHLVGMIQMEDGNDYTGVSKALAPFNAVAKLTGAHIFLLHHQPKTMGAGQEINVMGSEAFRAATDTLAETTKIGGNYFFRAQSRGVADIERLRIYKLEDGSLRAEAGVEGLKREIISALEGAEQPVTSAKLLEIAPELKGVQIKTVMMALKRLAETNEIIREGKGKRGSPFYYSLNGVKPPNLFGQ